MADKQKIHVFLGAPNPQSLSEDDLNISSSQWKTLEFNWNQGRLIPKKDATEGQIQSPGALVIISGQSLSTDTEKHSISKGKVTLPEDDITPSISQSKHMLPEDDINPRLVTEYLDSCFPSPLADPRSDSEPSPSMSTKTEYLSVWTKTQGLFLKPGGVREQCSGSLSTLGSPPTPQRQTPSASLGSPELYSPEVSPGDRGLGGTLQQSVELYESLSQRLQEGGVILVRTPDGLLCSQDSAAEQEDYVFQFDSPNKSVEGSPTPSTSKRAKLSSAAAQGQQATGQKNMLLLDRPTTLLSRCSRHGVSYSILVAVVHPCHLKEINVKSGPSAGSSVPLATVIVTDQSGVEMKVVLWRAAAFWALTVYPGDILLITSVTVHMDKWRGETVLQSSYKSQLLNKGQVNQCHNLQASQTINICTLRALCTYLNEKRPLLVSLPPRTTQNLQAIPFARLGSLRPDTIVHALLRVKHTNMTSDWRSDAEGVSRTGRMPKAVLTVEQENSRQGAVVLWGTALTWLQQIHTNKDAVWEFRLLLVKEDVTSGLLELHSTPWSTCQTLNPNNPRYKEFHSSVLSHRGSSNRSSSSFEIDLHTLLSQKYTGDIELKVHIVAFQFHSSLSQDAVLHMDRETPLELIEDIVSSDITFTGCGRCCAELDTDENGIYRPCYPCLPFTGVRRYYRPVVLTVRERQSQVCLHVPPTLVQKILLNTPPDKLNKTVAPVSEERFVQVIAKRIHSILSNPRIKFHLTVHSHFECDENDIPVIQNFLLLDFISQET